MANAYYNVIRKELLDLIPTGARGGTMLEIGAATGQTLLYAREHGYAKNIHGVELCNLIDDSDKKQFDTFTVGNIETLELPLEMESVDVILCGDVLEHLVDPYATVRKLRQYLKPNGVIVASIPNIREWNTLKKILLDADFRYEESGILDKTHLRFFCKKNIIELFEDNGYKVTQVTSYFFIGDKPLRRRVRHAILNFLTLGLYADLKTNQYYVVAQNN